jgi:hypothetical protein
MDKRPTMLEEADMTTSAYAPAPSAAFPSIYGQQGFYGQQPGYEQQFGAQPGGQQGFGQPSVSHGFPQLFGQQLGSQQQFGNQPQFGGPQQFGTQPQFGGLPQFGTQQQFGGLPQQGGVDQVAVIVQVLPQLLWAAQQNVAAALHLTQQLVMQITQLYGARQQQPRPYAMTW